MMGHQKGLNAVYANFEGMHEEGDERLEEVYIKAIPKLSIYGRSIVVAKTDEELRRKVTKHEQTINQLLKDSMVKDAKIGFLTEQGELKNAKIQQLNNDLSALKGRFDHFSKTMGLSPEELDALSEIIGKYLQEKNRQRFREQEEEDKESMQDLIGKNA